MPTYSGDYLTWLAQNISPADWEAAAPGSTAQFPTYGGVVPYFPDQVNSNYSGPAGSIDFPSGSNDVWWRNLLQLGNQAIQNLSGGDPQGVFVTGGLGPDPSQQPIVRYIGSTSSARCQTMGPGTTDGRGRVHNKAWKANAKGMPCGPRRMNPLNPKALSRSMRRMSGFMTFAKKFDHLIQRELKPIRPKRPWPQAPTRTRCTVCRRSPCGC